MTLTRRATAGWLSRVSLSLWERLELGPARHARKWQHVSDVAHSCDVHQCALEAEAETGMRHTSVLPDIQIPLVAFDVLDPHIAHSSNQHVIAFLALAAADDFSN